MVYFFIGSAVIKNDIAVMKNLSCFFDVDFFDIKLESFSRGKNFDLKRVSNSSFVS